VPLAPVQQLGQAERQALRAQLLAWRQQARLQLMDCGGSSAAAWPASRLQQGPLREELSAEEERLVHRQRSQQAMQGAAVPSWDSFELQVLLGAQQQEAAQAVGAAPAPQPQTEAAVCWAPGGAAASASPSADLAGAWGSADPSPAASTEGGPAPGSSAAARAHSPSPASSGAQAGGADGGATATSPAPGPGAAVPAGALEEWRRHAAARKGALREAEQEADEGRELRHK
jgi:hypothetical protein